MSDETKRVDVLYALNGMTLRQYYAAKAMQAFITAHVSNQANLTEEATWDRLIAKWSFDTADAMISYEDKA